MSMDQLAARVFAIRDFAHKSHWATSSYSRHVALGSFYDGVVDALDTLVECYQGRYGLIRPSNAEPLAGDIVKAMQADVDWCNTNRQQITRGDSSLSNLLDNLIAIYQGTLYKLTCLS